ncbi:DMT family transporter [Sporolactobacillus sp. THM7-4]|nr:DMT family transporter [Sporolactobacillus sp. THM7-4]
MSRRKADMMLVIATMFWGSSYLFMKMGLQSVEPFNLIALRFIIAFIITGCLFYKRLVRTDRRTLLYGFILGVNLFFVFTTVTFGVRLTSTSNAGFLVSLTVIFVPILSSLLFHKKLTLQLGLGIGLALTGIGLLTLKTHFVIGTGDFYCILCALFNAIYFITANKLTRNSDSIALGVWQLGFTGVLSGLFSLFTETTRLPGNTESWTAVLGLSLLCTAVGYIMQTSAQKFTTSEHTGLIFTLEPVFSALFAFLFAGEKLSVKGYVGAVLVLLSVLIAVSKSGKLLFQLPFPFKRSSINRMKNSLEVKSPKGKQSISR